MKILNDQYTSPPTGIGGGVFTPVGTDPSPTAEFQEYVKNIGGNDGNTSILLNFQTANSFSSIIDKSSNVHTVSFVGSPFIDTILPRALVLNGTTQYASIPAHTSLQPGSGACCIEFDMVCNSVSANNVLYLYGSGVGERLFFQIFSGNLRCEYDKAGQTFALQSTGGLVSGKRHHVAFTRDGSNNIALWIDGSQADSDTYSGTISDYGTPVGIGSDAVFVGGTTYFGGKIFWCRVSKGVPRFTGAFTPPEIPYDEDILIGMDSSGKKFFLGL